MQEKAQLPFMTFPLWCLFIAFILANTASSGAGLARALHMNGLNFTATAISSTGAIASLVTLPLSYMLGWGSDRLERKLVLIGAFAFVVLGGLILVVASSLWQFWLSAALLQIVGPSMGVGTALVTDIAPSDSVGTAISRFSSTFWIGAAIGFGGTGLLISNLDIHTTFLIGVGVAVIATLFVNLIRVRKPLLVAPVYE